MSTGKRLHLMVALILGVSGIAIVWLSVGWLPALGVWLALWGNNMQNSA